MTAETLILLSMVIPSVGAALIALTGASPNLRETVTLTAAGALFLVVLLLLGRVLDGARPEVDVFQIVPGLTLAFEVEPLGMLFAAVAATLWIVNSIYSIGYMRGNDEPRQTPFYVCFAIALASTMGVAFAANLFTLFLFYEILTLSTYPLVTHKADEKAMIGGRVYLVLLLGTSMVLFLPAIIATGVIAGSLDFTPGGLLAGKAEGPVVAILLALYVFGIGKAALMPLHFWLPAAMVAPTPVSALLHAVAVVKAGVFTVSKVVIYVFGLDFLRETGAGQWLVFVAAFSLIAASIVALTKNNLKARLAYSTVSQLAYVVLGASFANAMGLIGSGMHIAMHAAGKITLFFCAGAIYVATHKTEISDMAGIGRIMPVTMFAFLIGSLSIIGLPPLGGTWSKWFIAAGAVDSGHLFVLGVLVVSSLLNIAYLMPVVVRGYLLPPPGMAPGEKVRINEAPFACVAGLSVTALLCLVLFFQAGAIEELLAGAVSQSKSSVAGGAF
ncbi:MAG: monovalent cation/H+ antiporter subunit D family protein [Hyphomicrobiales bacterium]|nr:monovalent cation/H+ antiporter subunit D family protein [Hyphomicrobiales bacterium]